MSIDHLLVPRLFLLYTLAMDDVPAAPPRAIATSTLWQIASQLAMAAMSILTIKFVAMGLSKELAGNYHSAYGYLQLFGILADFGLYAVAVREVSKSNEKGKVLGALIVLRCIILTLSLGSALLLVWILPVWRGTPLPLGVTIAALVPFFTLLAGILRTVFQVTYRMHYVFIAEVTQRIVTVSLIGMLIALGVRGSNDLHIYHLFLFVGGIGAFVLFLLSLGLSNRLIKITTTVDRTLLSSLALQALPYGLAYLCMALYRQLDVTMIALLRPDFDLQNAYYGFALRAVDMGFLFPTFLLNSTLPLLASQAQQGNDTRAFLGKILLAILLYGLTTFLFALLWARPLMHLLTTEQYLSTASRPGSDTALALLSIPMLLNGLVLFCFYNLLARNAWRPLVASLFAGAVFSLICNLFLIPTLGFVGAAYTSIATHILLCTLLLPQSLRVLPARVSASQWFQTALYGLLLACALWVIRPFLDDSLRILAAGILMAPLMLGFLWGVGFQKVFLAPKQ